MHAKNFRFYSEGSEAPLRINFEISNKTLEQWMEAEMEAGRCVRRLWQSYVQRMICIWTDMVWFWRPNRGNMIDKDRRGRLNRICALMASGTPKSRVEL